MDTASLGTIREELEGAEIADWRLRQRLLSIAEQLDGSPEASLPKVLKTAAAREGAYRFLGNRKVTLEGILAPHVQATVRRCRNSVSGPIYVVSDTTECAFSGPNRGLRLGRLQGKSRGFLAHAALAVSSDGRPLGVLGIETLVRSDERKHRNIYQRKKDPDRESLRWGEMVDQTSALLDGCESIQVMDSEADIYELLTELQKKERRFIVRSGQDRLVEPGHHLRDALDGAQTLLTRDVCLSRRRGPAGKPATSRRNAARLGRPAQLKVSALRLALRRPKTCTAEYPAALDVNVVVVREINPPEGQQPVEWILFTSEPIATTDQVAAIVDGYRHRWLIEEYFKAIKTGCSYEDRELESVRTLTNMLAIVAVIAWRLLGLRAMERDDSQSPAAALVDPLLLEALAARLRDIREPKPLPSNPTVADFLRGIARLGGHITSNGRPGWQVLWRGYQDLLNWGGGYISRVETRRYSDQS
jgi:hypothetical protein